MMVFVNTDKLTELSDRIKSLTMSLNEISADLYLLSKGEKNSEDEEVIAVIKRQVDEMEQSIKILKKTALSMEKSVILCKSTEMKSLRIVESSDFSSVAFKNEKIKMNDLTQISSVLSDFKFDVS